MTDLILEAECVWPLEATHLRASRYAVRPKGTLGVFGWLDGKPWTVVYVNARGPQEAIRKARKRVATA